MWVQATYNLEGDGPLVLFAFEQIENVRNSLADTSWPRVREVISQQPSEEQVELNSRVVTIFCKVLEYFQKKFGRIQLILQVNLVTK